MIRKLPRLLLLLSLSPLYPWSLKTDSVFITPNHDGQRDTITFSFTQPKKQMIYGWKLEIRSKTGNVVRKYESDTRKKVRGLAAYNIFRSDRKYYTTVQKLPKKIIWNGTDDNGNILPDDSYSYIAEVTDSQNQLQTISEGTITLDSQPPECHLSADRRIIATEGRGREKYVKILQKGTGDYNDKWHGEWKNSSGQTVASWHWTSKNLPAAVTWNGRNEEREYFPAGTYSYHLTGTDEAGNTCRSQIRNFRISPDPEFVNVFSESESLREKEPQPVVFFTGKSYRLSPTSWDFYIYHQKKDKMKIYFHESGSKLPDKLEWKNKNIAGKLLKPGTYLYKLSLHTGDRSFESIPGKLIITDKKMNYSFSVNHRDFTPDGDEKKDLLIIKPVTTGLEPLKWKLNLYELYGPHNKHRTLIRQWQGNGRPGKIYWHGIKNNGQRIGSAATLVLEFHTRDELGRKIKKPVLKFRTGTGVYREDGLFRISVPENRLSETRSWLKKAKRIIKKYPGYRVEVQSHTNQSGDNDANFIKTEKRARQVFRYLYGKKEAFSRYRYRGAGEVDPLIHTADDYAMNKNRRIDFIIEER